MRIRRLLRGGERGLRLAGLQGRLLPVQLLVWHRPERGLALATAQVRADIVLIHLVRQRNKGKERRRKDVRCIPASHSWGLTDNKG